MVELLAKGEVQQRSTELGHTGREVSMALRDQGVLCKGTHEHTLRIAPPLVITREEIDHAEDALAGALKA